MAQQSGSEDRLAWFQELCQQLSRDPVSATETIKQFQDTSDSYPLSRYFFGLPSSPSPDALHSRWI
jgi:hypothetical protein